VPTAENLACFVSALSQATSSLREARWNRCLPGSLRSHSPTIASALPGLTTLNEGAEREQRLRNSGDTRDPLSASPPYWPREDLVIVSTLNQMIIDTSIYDTAARVLTAILGSEG